MGSELSAYWNGAVAISAFLANCWADVRATRLTRCPSHFQMVFAGPSHVPTAMPRESTMAPLPWRGTLQLGTQKPTSYLIPMWETNVLKSCRTAPELHLVVQFGCSSQIDLHPTGDSSGSKPKISGGTGSWLWWLTHWIGQLCQRGQRACCGRQLTQ